MGTWGVVGGVVDDEVGGFLEVDGAEVGLGLLGVLGMGVIGIEQYGSASGALARFDVADIVTDHPGLVEVEIVFFGGQLKHSGGGFAQVAGSFVFVDDALGVVGAVIEGVEVDIFLG